MPFSYTCISSGPNFWYGHIEDEGAGAYLVVTDQDECGRMTHRLTFSAARGLFHIGIAAQWSDDRPDELANYTPRDENDGGGSYFAPEDEITVADDGLLTALVRARAAGGVDIRRGWVARLPVQLVQPVRQAIETVRAEAAAQASTNTDRSN